MASTSPVVERSAGLGALQVGLQRLLRRPEVGAVAGTIAVFAFFAVVASDRGFLSTIGTLNYLEVAAELGILAAAVTLLTIAGEFDLSVGSMIGAAGILLALTVTHLGWDLWLAVPVTFAVAGAVGFANGYLVVRTQLPAFIVTLASLFVLRGVTIGLTGIIEDRTSVEGVTQALAGDPLLPFFTGSVLGVPVVVVWWLVLTAIAAFVLASTQFGNWIYGVGGDQTAARNTGVPVAKVKLVLFSFTALAAALVAIITVLNAGSADVTRGELKEFQAITATVIGGTLLTGGYGSAIGAAFGALIFGMVSQGIYFTGVDADWFQAFLGTMLLLAVIINHYTRRRAMESVG